MYIAGRVSSFLSLISQVVSHPVSLWRIYFVLSGNSRLPAGFDARKARGYLSMDDLARPEVGKKTPPGEYLDIAHLPRPGFIGDHDGPPGLVFLDEGADGLEFARIDSVCAFY